MAKSGYTAGKGKPNIISSLKRNAKTCDYPGCDNEARYYGKKKGTTHFFCTPHFKKYYHITNF
jgi:hypothetical protein